MHRDTDYNYTPETDFVVSAARNRSFHGTDYSIINMDVDHLEKNRIKQECQQFIAGIQTANVCALASRYNANRACTTFAEPKHGSYNVCFFVDFGGDNHGDGDDKPTQRWVVRFPLPSVHDVIGKLRSEVATMKLVDETYLRGRVRGFANSWGKQIHG